MGRIRKTTIPKEMKDKATLNDYLLFGVIMGILILGSAHLGII